VVTLKRAAYATSFWTCTGSCCGPCRILGTVRVAALPAAGACASPPVLLLLEPPHPPLLVLLPRLLSKHQSVSSPPPGPPPLPSGLALLAGRRRLEQPLVLKLPVLR
jgi:hypothetical protein